MIERGLVEQIVDDYHVKVRIPVFNKGANANGATPTSELQVCPIMCAPGVLPALKVGDMVIVGFEHDSLGSPVVLGLFFNSRSSTTVGNMESGTLNTRVAATLPSNTTIGEVTPQMIRNLVGVRTNVQLELDRLTAECHALRAELQQLRVAVEDERVRGCTL